MSYHHDLGDEWVEPFQTLLRRPHVPLVHGSSDYRTERVSARWSGATQHVQGETWGPRYDHERGPQRPRGTVPQWMVDHGRCDHGCFLVSNKSSHWRQEFTSRGLGENILIGSGIGSSKAAKGAADAFYAKLPLWNFYHPKGIFSHFGPSVWKGSTQLGVGVANGKSGMCAIIKYYPPGNLPELWSNLENVKLPHIQEKARSIYDQQYKRSDMVVKLGSKGTMTMPKSPALLLSLAWLTMFCSNMGRKTLLLLTLIPFIAFLINPSDAAVLEYQTVGQNAHNSYRSDHETPPLTLNEKLNAVAIRCAEYYANERKTIDHSCPHKTPEMGENLFPARDARTQMRRLLNSQSSCGTRRSRTTAIQIQRKATSLLLDTLLNSCGELGFGIAFRNKRSEFIVSVALYTPPGNIQDLEDWKLYKENVLRPINGSRGADLVREDSGASGLANGGIIIVQMVCLAVAVSGTFNWF
ncbi:Golgi-associated plant pathogenesis-related protein 1 [Orchesella cincta]|uniref:Golgi-associated plant pathogenesis-related protein 1 n=1 Tax=Orchesella cincta TaxID=48709 RepID=A0A1D2M1V1_ORCCI|nr:Golgi-associated plant pathogenesis-related protein 1 [Orchesella cincta]